MLKKCGKSYKKAKKIALKPKFKSDLFMGWVMGLEPVIKYLKCVGITMLLKIRVQFRVQMDLPNEEITKIFCSICNIFLG